MQREPILSQKEAASLLRPKSIWTSARRAARKSNPTHTGAFVLDVPLALFPKTRARVGKFTNRAGHLAERADIALGKPLSRIPVIGGLFRTTKKKVKSTTIGARTRISDRAYIPEQTTTRTREYPTAKLTAPITKGGKILTPLLAFMGAHQLMSSWGPQNPQEGEQKMSSMGSCGHEHLLRENSHMLKSAAAEITRLQREKDLLLTEFSNALFASEAEKVASDMVDRGLISEEERLHKVAEFISGHKKISAVKEALDIVQPGRVPPIGQLDDGPRLDGSVNNEAIDFLWQLT